MTELRIKRGRLGLTMKQVSEATGITVPTISNVENGKHKPHATTYAILNDFYNGLEKQRNLSKGNGSHNEEGAVSE